MPQLWTDWNGKRRIEFSGKGKVSVLVEDVLFLGTTDDGKCRVILPYAIGEDGGHSMIVGHPYKDVYDALNDNAGNRELLSDNCSRPTD